MTTWNWELIASLILLAVGTSIKAASGAVTIKRLNDDIAALRKQIEVSDQKFNETTKEQSVIHAREKDELTARVFELSQIIQRFDSSWSPGIL